jgi:uncharacterized protein YaaN involved in tellurite resistance
MLRTQSAQVYEQAAGATVSLEKLQLAFKNIYETIDMISAYKQQALGVMQQSVTTLSAEVRKSQSYLDRVRAETAAAAVADVQVAGDDARVVNI